MNNCDITLTYYAMISRSTIYKKITNHPTEVMAKEQKKSTSL